jgi:hypothetical protein
MQWLIKLRISSAYYDINNLITLVLSKKIPIGTFVVNEYRRDIGNLENFYGARSDFEDGNMAEIGE